MKIVCIGDSLTYGFGVLKKHNWIEITEKSFENIQLINKGINGDTTSGMLSRSYEDIILNYPEKAIIMGGTNDFIASYNPKRVEENIIELLKECAEHQIEPIIAIQIPINENMAKEKWAKELDYHRINKNIEVYRENIINYCNENSYKYIDFYKDFLENTNKDMFDKYYTDGLHPNYEGHKIMSDSVVKVLRTLIK